MKSKKVAIITIGHGGLNPKTGEYVTNGKRSPIWEDGAQYFEGVGNRDIAKHLKYMLDYEGYKYHILPVGWVDTPPMLRAAAVNALAVLYGVNNCIGIEIHSNGHTTPDAKGWAQYIAQRSSSTTKEFAATLYGCMKSIFPGEKFRKPTKEQKWWTKPLTMTSGTICPFVLTENFFHTNPHECRNILMTEEGRKKIAKGIFNALKIYMEQ